MSIGLYLLVLGQLIWLLFISTHGRTFAPLHAPPQPAQICNDNALCKYVNITCLYCFCKQTYADVYGPCVHYLHGNILLLVLVLCLLAAVMCGDGHGGGGGAGAATGLTIALDLLFHI